jgi:hypothetical protein
MLGKYIKFHHQTVEDKQEFQRKKNQLCEGIQALQSYQSKKV